MASAVEPTLPRVFGRYLLVSRLSRGGMGEIFLAKVGEIQGFQKLCIIKKVLPHLAEDRDFIKRFIDEAQIAVKLSHANIAPVFEVGMVEGEYFLAIDYVQGRDLRRTLSRCQEDDGKVPIDVSLYIGREMANGLAYAHRKTDDIGRPLGVVHCDISPPNILISYEGEVKVIDFGIAKSSVRIAETNPKVGFGKFGYMAPEQLLRGGVIDKRTDIYAAGVVLYEILTGERVFTFPEGADYRTIARIVAQGKLAPPSQKNHELIGLDEVVMRALHTDPNQRFQTAEELRDALQEKLVRRNATFSTDSCGKFLRDLFTDEITDERSLVAEAQAADLAPFREQMEGARTHTVSFALIAGEGGQAEPPAPAAALSPRRVSGQHRAPGEPGSITETVAKTEGRSRRRSALIGALAGGLVVGIILFVVFGLDRTSRAKEGESTAKPSDAAATSAPQELIVTHLNPPDQPADVTPVAVTPPTTPVKPVIKKPSSKDRDRDKPKVIPPEKPSLDPASVQSKFRSVSREYNSFKRDFGPRLENEWNDIVQMVTYGGADKLPKVSALLDRLRSQMSKIRKDQG